MKKIMIFGKGNDGFYESKGLEEENNSYPVCRKCCCIYRGGIAQADFNAGTILPTEQERDYLAAGTNQYFYAVTGGNAYLDNNTKDLVGEINNVVNYVNSERYQEDRDRLDELNAKNETGQLTEDEQAELNELALRQMILGLGGKMIPGEISGTVGAVNDKTAGGSDVISGGTELNLKGYAGEDGSQKDWVRYYGAVGGDMAVNLGLTGKIQVSADASVSSSGTSAGSANIADIDVNYTNPEKTVIDRTGDVNIAVGSDESSVSVIGGVGGSAAVAVGNLTMDMEKEASKDITISESGYSIEAQIKANVQDVKLQGETETYIRGNVNTQVHQDANVVGWMNGGLAAGIGGKAASEVTGNTTLTIDGTDRRTDIGTDSDPDTVGTILNLMKGSGVNAVGVMGGGSAVTTLGGTAEAKVDGTSTVNINNATVIGVIGGGAAASVDATGVLEQIYKPNGQELQLGKNDGTTDINGAQIDAILTQNGILGQGGSLGNIFGDGLVPDDLTITAKHAIDGGTATSTTGDTYVNITGDSTAVGVIGGGMAVASHTYTVRPEGEGGALPDGYDVNDEYGASRATATTGKSHITVNLTGETDKSGLLSGALDGQSAAVGVFGGGAAIAQSGNRQFVDEENKDQALSTTDGAFATASTAGSDIELAGGYIAGVMGGGIAAVDNNATATAEMTDTVNITIGGYVDEEGNELDPEVVGVFGNGLAYYTGSSNKGTYSLKGQAVASAKDTNILVRSGSVDGIYGGGMAIDDSQADVTNAKAETNGTVNITVTGGTVNATNLSVLKDVSYVNGISGAAENAAIVAGGIALGGGAEAYVKDAVVNIAGDAAVNGDIYGGGIAAYGWEGVGGSKVDTSTINLMGGTVTGNVYAGGAVNTADLDNTGGGYTHASATVGSSVINWGSTDVTGILSGQGTVNKTVSDSDQVKVTESTLNIIGNHTLSTVKSGEGESQTESSKIQGFDNVNFAAGSETTVKDLTANGSTALIDGGKVTIEDGAWLNIENLETGFENEGTSGNSYNIAANTSDSSTFWKDSDLVYDRMSGVYATAEVTNGTEGDSDTSFQVKYEKITADNADEAADSMAEALGAKDLRSLFREGMLDGWKNAGEGAKGYFEEWQLAPELNAQYGRGMLLGEDAAVTGNTVSIARAMADNVTQRLSFTDDYVQEQGWANQDGGVWAKYMHRKYETDGMGSSMGGIHSSTDYDGILVGVDFAKKGKFQSGVAIHYGSGDGDGLISHNDYDAWGITLYGSLKDEEAGTNLMADIGWMTSDNDIDGTVGSQRLTANRDVDAWTVGVRGEKEFVSGRNQIVPYAGLRYMSVNPGSYTVYSNGKAAFENDADNQNLWLLPVGVSFRNETVTAGGWKITPKLDVSYIWAFGDTDTDMTVNAGSYGSTLYYDVTDDSSWLASLGVEAEKDAWTFGVSYGYQKGDDTKNKTWFVTAGYSF